MKYIIVNNSTWDAFYAEVQRLLSSGYDFTFSYVEHIDDNGVELPGGWGCARFADILPVEKIFTDADDVEYRYSEEKDAWLVDGEFAPHSNYIKSLYNYFVSLEGGVTP